MFWSLAREIIDVARSIEIKRSLSQAVDYVLLNYIRDTTNHEMRSDLFNALQAERNETNKDLINAILRAYGAHFRPR